MKVDEIIAGWKKRKNAKKERDINKNAVGVIDDEERKRIEDMYASYYYEAKSPFVWQKKHKRKTTKGFTTKRR